MTGMIFFKIFLRGFASLLTDIPSRLAFPMTAFLVTPPNFCAISRALMPLCQSSLSFVIFSGVHS